MSQQGRVDLPIHSLPNELPIGITDQDVFRQIRDLPGLNGNRNVLHRSDIGIGNKQLRRQTVFIGRFAHTGGHGQQAALEVGIGLLGPLHRESIKSAIVTIEVGGIAHRDVDK